MINIITILITFYQILNHVHSNIDHTLYLNYQILFCVLILERRVLISYNMKSAEDLNSSYPTTAPPPYPGPPVHTSQPLGSDHIGPHSTYTAYPNHPQASVTVVHGAPVIAGVQHVIVAANNMGPSSAVYTCPSCSQQIVTRTVSRPTIRTHLCAALLCVIGCWPCVFIPYCTDGCSNTDHYCPNCSAYIGSYIG